MHRPYSIRKILVYLWCDMAANLVIKYIMCNAVGNIIQFILQRYVELPINTSLLEWQCIPVINQGNPTALQLAITSFSYHSSICACIIMTTKMAASYFFTQNKAYIKHGSVSHPILFGNDTHYHKSWYVEILIDVPQSKHQALCK